MSVVYGENDAWVPVCGSGAVLRYKDPRTDVWQDVCSAGNPIRYHDPVTDTWVSLCCRGGTGPGGGGPGGGGGPTVPAGLTLLGGQILDTAISDSTGTNPTGGEYFGVHPASLGAGRFVVFCGHGNYDGSSPSYSSDDVVWWLINDAGAIDTSGIITGPGALDWGNITAACGHTDEAWVFGSETWDNTTPYEPSVGYLNFGGTVASRSAKLSGVLANAAGGASTDWSKNRAVSHTAGKCIYGTVVDGVASFYLVDTTPGLVASASFDVGGSGFTGAIVNMTVVNSTTVVAHVWAWTGYSGGTSYHITLTPSGSSISGTVDYSTSTPEWGGYYGVNTYSGDTLVEIPQSDFTTATWYSESGGGTASIATASGIPVYVAGLEGSPFVALGVMPTQPYGSTNPATILALGADHQVHFVSTLLGAPTDYMNPSIDFANNNSGRIAYDPGTKKGIAPQIYRYAPTPGVPAVVNESVSILRFTYRDSTDTSGGGGGGTGGSTGTGGGGGVGGGSGVPVTSGAPYFAPATPTNSKRVFAHYFTPYPTAFTDVNSTVHNVDYYDLHYLYPYPGGADGPGTPTAYGGLLRDRPIRRTARGDSNFLYLNILDEVTTAKAAGIDGFTLDLLTSDLTDMNGIACVHVMQAAAATSGFGVILMPDATAGPGALSASALATLCSTLLGYGGGYQLADGRYVISPFGAEAKPPAYWSAFSTAMIALGKPVAFIPCFIGSASAYRASYSGVSYGLSDWGSRSPQNNPTGTGAGSPKAQIATIRGSGLKWMQPVAVQDSRPDQFQFAEALNTTLLRNGWDIAINGNADLVQIPTWNDFSENAHIVPSEKHGSNYLDLMSYYIQWFKTDTQPPITADAVFLTHRTQFASTPDVIGETQRMYVRSDSDSPRDFVEALVFLTDTADVHITTSAGTTTVTGLAAGIHAVTAPLAIGSISASIVRSGSPVASVSSPFTVTGSPAPQDLQYVVSAASGTPIPPPPSGGGGGSSGSIGAPGGTGVQPTSGTRYQDLAVAASLSARLNLATSVSMPAGTFSFADFLFNSYGIDLENCRDLRGAGSLHTVFQMLAHSSTKGGTVAGIPVGSTNPFRLMHGGKSGQTLHLEGFELRGTDQGHLFGGLDIMYSTDAVLRDILVTGIAGGPGYPPFETFSISAYRANGILIDQCTADGNRVGGGSKVASSLIGINSTNNATIQNTVMQHSQAMGCAIWHANNATIRNATIEDVWRPVNIEQCSGTFTLDHVRFGAHTNSAGMVCVMSYPGYGGSVQVDIVEPDWTPNPAFHSGKFVVSVPSTYDWNGTTYTNPQSHSDIHLTLGGVPRNDLLQFI